MIFYYIFFLKRRNKIIFFSQSYFSHTDVRTLGADLVGEKPQLWLRHTQHSVQRHLEELSVLIIWSI